MKKTIFVLLFFISSILSYSAAAQERNYLLHTDANITRLKERIAENDSFNVTD